MRIFYHTTSNLRKRSWKREILSRDSGRDAGTKEALPAVSRVVLAWELPSTDIGREGPCCVECYIPAGGLMRKNVSPGKFWLKSVSQYTECGIMKYLICCCLLNTAW